MNRILGENEELERGDLLFVKNGEKPVTVLLSWAGRTLAKLRTLDNPYSREEYGEEKLVFIRAERPMDKYDELLAEIDAIIERPYNA